MAAKGWSTPFEDPIPLPRGGQLVTLQDAADYILKLPKAEQNLKEWQAVMAHAAIAIALLDVIDSTLSFEGTNLPGEGYSDRGGRVLKEWRKVLDQNESTNWCYPFRCHRHAGVRSRCARARPDPSCPLLQSAEFSRGVCSPTNR
jgi:hypothetical protein